MDLPLNPFKRAIKAGQQQIGLWSSLSSNISVEILAGAGFDWLLLDTEHSPNELPMVLEPAPGGAPAAPRHPIVRPAWNDAVLIKRFLDVGVADVAGAVRAERGGGAQRAVAATRYPPRGIRGVAGTDARLALRPRARTTTRAREEEICVLVQVETRVALDNLEAIAAVEGVDGVFIGPGDLSADLGYLGDLFNPDVTAVIDDAIARIKAAGSIPGILIGDEALARHYIDAGCLYTAVGGDVAILARGAEQLARRFKPALP